MQGTAFFSLSAMAYSSSFSSSESGRRTSKVFTLSTICSYADMPLSTIFTLGRPWSQRKLQAGMLSSGRRLFNRASSASDSFARRPPRTGSMTHTGMPRSVSSSYLVLPSWSFQSSQFSCIWQNSITSP